MIRKWNSVAKESLAHHARVDAILGYWFTADYDRSSSPPQSLFDRWFLRSREHDDEIRALFSADLERAVEGHYAEWANNKDGLLAKIILLDQFSRQIHRGSSRAFAYDPLALSLAKELAGG